MDNQSIRRISWDEFRDMGMLWFINNILHVFGLAIVVSIDNNHNITEVYPARVSFRGFPESSNTRGYRRISEYMKEHANELLEESME